jgi:hypothetical protein
MLYLIKHMENTLILVNVLRKHMENTLILVNVVLNYTYGKHIDIGECCT